jgi:hypothetical protein
MRILEPVDRLHVPLPCDRIPISLYSCWGIGVTRVLAEEGCHLPLRQPDGLLADVYLQG